ncbi:hypothetical protein [Streptomyces sp. NPDC058644]|uniref:hypothetical protein n=1 Tax=unclassified Streptomyces TaxID=2593676 RepID=UPI00365FA084
MNYQPHPDDHALSDQAGTGQPLEDLVSLAELDALIEELADKINAHLGIQRGEGPK